MSTFLYFFEIFYFFHSLIYLNFIKPIIFSYFSFLFCPNIYGLHGGHCPGSSTRMVSSPILIILQKGKNIWSQFLNIFHPCFFSPGKINPWTLPEHKSKTISTICPSRLPSRTLTTSLHLNSINDVSTR